MDLHHPELLKYHNTNRGVEQLTAEPDYGKILSTWGVLRPEGNRNYYITDTVIENLELLKVSRDSEGRYDYKIFSHLKSQKCTFILPDNKLIRMWIPEPPNEIMAFEYVRFDKYDKVKYMGHMNSCMFYLNRVTGEQCSHFGSSDVKEIEDILYKMLCFVYLSDTEEVILKPGQKMGTRKSGKIINEVRHPLIVVTSKWNVTSVRTEGFAVSGHFRLQRVGEGRQSTRVIWIDPFEKKGYIRTAKKDLV